MGILSPAIICYEINCYVWIIPLQVHRNWATKVYLIRKKKKISLLLVFIRYLHVLRAHSDGCVLPRLIKMDVLFIIYPSVLEYAGRNSVRRLVWLWIELLWIDRFNEMI